MRRAVCGSRSRNAVIPILLAALAACACEDPSTSSPAQPPEIATPEAARYVGVEDCARCHAEQTHLWRGSHHDLAMQIATPESMLGNFEETSFEHAGQLFRFHHRDDRFFVETAGADGTTHEFQITHTFGFDPLQQYLVPLAGGRLQALGVAWDTRPLGEGGQRWFHLQPDESVPPGDVLHWTGPAGSWNAMCADCHSTNFSKGYNEANSSYTSSWSEIDVACEACHGPGSTHVTWAERGADPKLAGRGLRVLLGAQHEWSFAPTSPIAHREPAPTPGTDTEVETCAPCHARRAQIAKGAPGSPFLDTYRPALLDEGLYYADGQILDEVYVWGSFLQSRMHAAGVVCSDCHDPHRLEIAEPDTACARCHQSETFSTTSHHHHETDSPGTSCVGCHMPNRHYMVIDKRHDHSFRIPRPDLSLEIGVPNACTGCHRDRSDAWAADATTRWYGAPDSKPRHYGEVLAAGRIGAPGAASDLAELAQDSKQPALVRATALELVGRQLTRAAFPALVEGLDASSPIQRMAAVGAFEALPVKDRWLALERRLKDDFRSVRIEAARVLAPLRAQISDPRSRETLDAALAEYKQTQALNADWPSAHVNLGILYSQLGDFDESVREYQEAMRIGPYFLPAYINLAETHRLRGRDDEGERVLRNALARFPDNADVHHALGLALIRSQRSAEALAALERASMLSPENPRYAYVYGIALNSSGDRQGAIEFLSKAHRAHPASREILMALATLHKEAGDHDEALVFARKLLELNPEDPEALSLLRALESAGR